MQQADEGQLAAEPAAAQDMGPVAGEQTPPVFDPDATGPF
jgi:hypothetical protein